MNMLRKSLVAAVLTLFGGSAMAYEGETFTSDRMIQDSSNRVWTVLYPKGDQKCEHFNSASTVPDKAKILGQMIVAEAFIPKRASYVYWLVDNDGTHEVFVTAYIIRNCVVTEGRSNYEQFNDVDRNNRASEYYTHTLQTY